MLVQLLAEEGFQRVIQFACGVAESDQRIRVRSDFGYRTDRRFAEPRRRGIDQIGHQVIDHAPQNLVNKTAARQCGGFRLYFVVVASKQRHGQQLFDADEAGAYAVFHVVIVVGNLIGKVRKLRLQTGLLTIDEALAHLAQQQCVVVGAVFENSFAAFKGQVQAVELGVVLLELIDHAQRLQVVFETAEIRHALVQRILPRMTERCVPKIVREADRLGQLFVELQCAGGGSGYLRDLERMGQAGSIQITFVVDEHLGLVDQPPKCGGVHDAIAIALIFGSILGGRLWVAAPPRMLGMGGIRRKPAHLKCSASVASSAAFGYWSVMIARPSFSKSTRRTAPATTFLSICINS